MSSIDITTETKTEAKRKFFIEQIVDKKYQIVDGRTFDDLAKMCHDVLKIPRGSMHDTKKILGKVCQEQGISFKAVKKSKGLNLKIEMSPRDPAKLAARQPTPTQNAPNQPITDEKRPGISTNGAPNQPQPNQPQQQEQKKILPPLTEQDLPRYSRKSFRFLKLIDKVYLKLSLVTEEEVQERQNEFQDLSQDIADYCIETNSRLPAKLDYYLILAQLGLMIIIPIGKWFMKPRKKDDKKKENIKQDQEKKS